MKNNWLKFVLAAAGTLFFISGSALAHHGQANYDTKNVVTVTGSVTEFQFVNPHCIVYFDVKNDKGQMEKWQGELTSPNRLVRSGWNQKSIKPGDKVTVTGWRAAGGANSMWVTKLIANGEELTLGGGD